MNNTSLLRKIAQQHTNRTILLAYLRESKATIVDILWHTRETGVAEIEYQFSNGKSLIVPNPKMNRNEEINTTLAGVGIKVKAANGR